MRIPLLERGERAGSCGSSELSVPIWERLRTRSFGRRGPLESEVAAVALPRQCLLADETDAEGLEESREEDLVRVAARFARLNDAEAFGDLAKGAVG